jgi:hypothetical protein
VNRHLSIALRLLLLALNFSCADDSQGAAVPSDLSARTLTSELAAREANHPFAHHALPQTARHWIAGHVEERVVAGNYVYLRLREPSGSDSWLVSLKATTPTAPDVDALIVGRAARFHSRQLDRDFSPLLFAAVRTRTN